VGASVAVTITRSNRPPIPVLLEPSEQARLIMLGSSGRRCFGGMHTGSITVAAAAHAEGPSWCGSSSRTSRGTSC
jgi:hypothetical protein